MLQQTRVTVAIGYYERFMKRFPDVRVLARAREASVLSAWSGLGYYRRARGLHAAAKMIVREFDGSFPNSLEELRKLPGVGRYTAAAIASIAFQQNCAVVDGNVERVLDRVMGTGIPHVSPTRNAPNDAPSGDSGANMGHPQNRDVWAIAQRLLSPERPGDFNEAMMELGATVCLPGQPLCETCPVADLCVTRGKGQASKTKARQKRELKYLLATKGQAVYLVKRPAKASLMAGMWELPQSLNESDGNVLFRVRHAITNTDYAVAVVESKTGSGGEWISFKAAPRLGLTGLARKILRKAGLIE